MTDLAAVVWDVANELGESKECAIEQAANAYMNQILKQLAKNAAISMLSAAEEILVLKPLKKRKGWAIMKIKSQPFYGKHKPEYIKFRRPAPYTMTGEQK